jgi:hypothetical protein
MRTLGRLALPFLLLAVLASCDEAPKPPPPEVPALGDLNPHVLAVLGTYPTDGTHRYHWPKTGAWRGNARTLRYDGRVLCEGDPEGRCHCCGLTFEVFLQAWERWCKQVGRPYRIKDFDLEKVRRLQTEWFGSPEDRSTLHTALVGNGLGVRVTDWEQARAGDFVQLWRRNGTGHSVIFKSWRREGGRIVGLTYWSTQSSTRGIAENTELFGDTGSLLDRSLFWLCRPGR